MHSPLRLAFNATAWHPSFSEWMYAGNCIQPEERKRISEFHYKDDAKLSLIGRLLIRYAVSLCTGINWRDLHLVRNEKMKPTLDEQHNCSVNFNASHQGDYVVVVTDNVRVGVDVMDTRERHGNKDKFFNLMTRHFTAEEWKEIKSHCDSNLQMESFYRYWCLKESFVKALGVGIGYSLQSLSFATKSALSCDSVVNDTVVYIKKHLDNDWSFEESILGGNHTVAVARNCQNQLIPAIPFKEVTYKDITDCSSCLPVDDNVDALFKNCFNNSFKRKMLS